ncbi:MAG TPA: PQQ-binding-like beta-propeller repeat protein [Tepidisphaeraceae bacterium]|nr:PQQ-binding-like beta-propeller repeat protein [Tepidisphaeraceae bacterium]
MPHLRAILLSVFLVSNLMAAEDWPQFRGPNGQGISNAKNVPVRWSATSNVAWKTEIPGQGWSSPVLSGGKIYLTTAVLDGNIPTSLRAICIDAQNGKLLWNNEVFHRAAVPSIKHDKNSFASPTPIVTADRLFTHFGHLGTATLDLAGNIVWTQTELNFPSVHGNAGSPTLLDEMLIFNCDGARNPFIVALDARSGQVKWKTPRNTPSRAMFSFSTPLAIDVDGATQIVSPASGIVAAYDPSNGKEIWRVGYGLGYSVVPRPIYSGGLVLLSSGFDNPVVYAIDPKGAKGDVTATKVAWKERKGAPCTPSIVAEGNEVYWVSDGGIATCADARSGKTHWTHRLGGNFSASPVAAEGRIYFQNEAGMGYVVKAGKTFELLSENDLGERSLASYCVSDSTLFIRTENHLWKIGSEK